MKIKLPFVLLFILLFYFPERLLQTAAFQMAFLQCLVFSLANLESWVLG